jgi:arsenite/tail-anchored protein-transporting ATPase
MTLPLLKKPVQFVLFGGKGGVGKTTMAVSTALAIANLHPKKKVLVFTTDPAPSLGHCLGQAFSTEIQKVKGVKNLWALEIDAQTELKKFKKEYGEEVLDILQQGTYLSDEEAEDMFSLDIPGLDEIMGLKKIMDLMQATPGSKDHYDVFILDTAPTGHTLRLLTLPKLLDEWIKFLASLRWKYHYMAKRFSGETAPKKADQFLLEMKKTVKRVQELLKDPKRTAFLVVTLPESMVVSETRRLVADLQKFHIPIHHLLINHVIPSAVEAPFLKSRRKIQNRHLKAFRQAFPGLATTKIELQPGEVQGIKSLIDLGKHYLS